MTDRPAQQRHPLAHVAPLVDGEVRAGLYAIRLVKGAPRSAVRIWHGPPHDPVTGEELDRSWRWQATLNGVPCPLDRVWPACVGEPIDKATHDYLAADRRWAAQHAPHLPEAQPDKPVDWATAPLPF